MTETDELKIWVESRESGYDVVFTINGELWKRLGPYDDLDVANMICREALLRAQRIADRWTERQGNAVST